NKGTLPQDASNDGTDGTQTGAIGLDGAFPSPGHSNPKEDANQYWWNALPPLISQKRYYDLIQLDTQKKAVLPNAGTNSLFTCPAAPDPSPIGTDKLDSTNQYFMVWFDDITGGSGGTSTQKTYMCYVINSKMNHTINALNPTRYMPIKINTL